MLEISELRHRVEEDMARQLWAVARQHLAELWHRHPTVATASYILSCQKRLRGHLQMVPYRAALLRSFTVEPLVALLRAGAFAGGIDLEIYVGKFNTYAQEVLDSKSDLYNADPDVVILAVETCDIAPDLWDSHSDLSPADARAAVRRVIQCYQDYLQAFRERSQAYLIVHDLEEAEAPVDGRLDRLLGNRQAAVQEINQELRRMIGAYPGLYVLDYNGLVARHGRKRWHDERKWQAMRLPIASDKLIYLVRQWLRFIHPMSGKVCKVLVTDLDNTLWGGVIGEDGIDGIKCDDYPGSGYQNLQREMLEIYNRGILLAISSKNNEVDAIEALEHHPDLLLRPHHFSARRINWEDKVHNIREIAAELNIGTDSFAYIDDNPVELEWVRRQLPELCVIEMPHDPAHYADALRENPVFERLALSGEDRERQRYYAEQRRRLELEQRAPSLEEFYRSLSQVVEVAQVTEETADRAAQLTQKTNQFNLTTRRYSRQQIMHLAARPGWRVFTVSVEDRFGNNGLVGVAITHNAGTLYEIDTFLLSCRVIGRTVETALLSFLVERTRTLGARELRGRFLPTKKNSVAKDFYLSHGFQLLDEDVDGSLWSIDLATARINCPQWIKLKVLEGALS
jgi:FkbH-like protein